MKILIAGVSGSIATALFEQLKQQGHNLATISRQPFMHTPHLQTDLSASCSVVAVRQFVQDFMPDVVFCCAGLLHSDQLMPEKALTQFNDERFMTLISVNLLAHIHLAQAVAPLVTRTHAIKWISLSAMVGSIEDNQLGGWYSYRICKAALNMFIKNLSIEWARKSPLSIVVAQHPGTTQSKLSKPFQAHLATNKLYAPDLTATRLIAVMSQLKAQQHGRLLHWDGSILPY